MWNNVGFILYKNISIHIFFNDLKTLSCQRFYQEGDHNSNHILEDLFDLLKYCDSLEFVKLFLRRLLQ